VWFAHQHGVARWIAVTAYTHRAVINLMGDIGPTTADMVFGTSSDLFKLRWGNDTHMRGTRANLNLQETWKDIRLLIVDERFTMTGKHFAAIEQQLLLTMRDCGRTPDSSHSLFGGIGVLLTGDHHQNRPVHGAPLFQGNGDIRTGTVRDAASRTAANAHRDGPVWDTQFVSNARGRHILGQLHTTVMLKTHFRMEPYLSALNDRLRGGCLTDADFDDINACAVGAPDKPASIHHPNLRNAHFMMLRHTVGDAIVHALLQRRAAEDQHQLIR
jgi:hypothetical protein